MAKSTRITLTEVARQAGTSPMAVSVVLNGARSNTRVSDATRRRIVEVASGLNYSPNAMAQGLKRQRTGTIGVLFNWAGTHTVHDLFSTALLDGIVAGAAAAGYHILLYTKPWRDAATSSPLFSDRRTDGVIVVAPDETSDVVPGLSALGLPIILLSSATDVPSVQYVKTDNTFGVSLALDHLWDLGHKRIAFASQGQARHSMWERSEAYATWMARHSLPVPNGYALGDLDMGHDAGNVSRLKGMLSLPDRPTAVFAATDDLAVEVLEAALSVGLTVPEQLSVVGFDDILLASLTVPKLTTIRQPLHEMGLQSTHLLIATIEGREKTLDEPACHITVPELIVRASTAPLASARP